MTDFPEDEDAREQLATIYADHYGRVDLAAEQLEILIARPHSSANRVARWLNLSACWQIQKARDVDGARDTLQRIIDLFPNRAVSEVARRRLVQLIRLATRTEFLSPIAWYRRKNPAFRLVENMADRFRKHGEAFFLFITTPGMEPTNNLAEQAIRFIVIGRRVTQGTRGQNGRQFCQRIWTTWATCKIQGRSTFQFLVDSYQAWLHRSQPPDLLPSKTLES